MQNDEELKQWILDGVSERFRQNPTAQFFLQRAPIKMPAYRHYLTDEELDALKTYILWLRKQKSPSE